MFSEHLPDNEEELKAHIRALASERIRYFEKKIQDEFGLSVQAGIELEFFGEKGKRAKHLSLSKLKNVLSDVPFLESVKNDIGWGASPKTMPMVSLIGLGMYASDPQSPGLAITSGILMSAYASVVRHLARQYEITFNNTINDQHHSLAELADAVTKTRTTLETHAKDVGVDTVSFESKYYPHTLHYRTAPSMHVNLSLWSAQKENVFLDNKVYDACEKAMLDMQYESGLVMLGTRNAYDSIREGYNRPQQVRAGAKMYGNTIARRGSTKESKRQECRLPRADTDPHLTLLASVAALHEGLQRAHDPRSHTHDEETPESRPLPRDIYEAYNRFDESEMTKRLFGSELHEAVLKLYDKELSKDDIINWGPYPSNTSTSR